MKFRHPIVQDGGLFHEGESYPIVGGLVDCPANVGHDHGFVAANESEPAEKPPVLIPSLAEYVKAGYPEDRYAHFVARRIEELEAHGVAIPAEFESFRMMPVAPVAVSILIEGITVIAAIVPPVTEDEQKLLAMAMADGQLTLVEGQDVTEAVQAMRPTPDVAPAVEVLPALVPPVTEDAKATPATKPDKSERKRR